MSVVTRFAPSPTGFLHIGGARTALFNWLFAQHHARHGDGGEFSLRIEDTDRRRYSTEAVDAIYEGLNWLGLKWDGAAVSQFSRIEKHKKAVAQLLEEGKAYRCYCTPDELNIMRAEARKTGQKRMYDGRWRDRDIKNIPKGIEPTIRLKAPRKGVTTVDDKVQGEVSVSNTELDDMILLRSDGTPTYMLAVVVDDYEMGVTHVIRGDDHFTNAFRQIQLFKAFGWDLPTFAHIPLIHGTDGAKMSKRHGALGVDVYRAQGFLPEAICNYLLRLGWGHGNDEVISINQAIDWFDLDKIGKAPARFDFDKLSALNRHYLSRSTTKRLVALILPGICDKLGFSPPDVAIRRLTLALPSLKKRVKVLPELIELALIYVIERPIVLNEKAKKYLDDDGLHILQSIRDEIAQLVDWTDETLQGCFEDFSKRTGVKIGKLAQPVRAALVGTTVSPSIFEILAILGRQESLARIGDAVKNSS